MNPAEVNAVIIDTEGNAEIRYIRPDLDTIKGLLGGGWLEAIGPLVDTYGDWHAYVDEEGKIKRLPINHAATLFAQSIGWGWGDTLRGPVVFLGRAKADSEDGGAAEGDVPTEVVKAALDFYREFGKVDLGH